MLVTSVDLLLFLGTGFVSFAAAVAALWVYSRLDRAIVVPAVAGAGSDKIAFLFSGTDLVDATPAGEKLLKQARTGDSDWNTAMSVLVPLFPEIPAKLTNIDTEQRVEAVSASRDQSLVAETVGDKIRLKIIGKPGVPETVSIERNAFTAMTDEVETLRASVENIPFLVWRQSVDGPVTWANRAYFAAIEEFFDESTARIWPPASLCTAESLEQIVKSDGPRRLAIQTGECGAKRWYECSYVRLGDGYLFSAVNIDGVVSAESQRQEFTQTLTKTFSHLTAGLAVFDASRRLALFNPALIDLTSLPTEFMVSRPTLSAFLDRLRDRQMIPEPKDYKNWRRHMADLEAAAEDGTYSETWSLPNGQTYRVTGRPHPDGAVAFVIEDISAEMSLTRKFRTELDLSQAVIDSFDEAIAVFSPNGLLSLSNAAYDRLWASDAQPADALGTYTVTEASRIWMTHSRPTPVWGEVRNFVLHGRDRAPWNATLALRDDRMVDCRIEPLAGGATLVGFRTSKAAEAPDELSSIHA